ncbi:Stomatin-like protein 1, partial [Varanus komodoensis]
MRDGQNDFPSIKQAQLPNLRAMDRVLLWGDNGTNITAGEGAEPPSEAPFLNSLVHQLRPYLESHCLAVAIHALVTSQLDYCNVLSMRLPLKTVQILQLVQNRAARLLTGTGHYSHIMPVLCQCHWLAIEVQAQFKVLVLTYKALSGLGPGYLKDGLLPRRPSHPLRSAGEALLRERSLRE